MNVFSFNLVYWVYHCSGSIFSILNAMVKNLLFKNLDYIGDYDDEEFESDDEDESDPDYPDFDED